MLNKRYIPWLLATIPLLVLLITLFVGGIHYQPFPDSSDYLTLGDNFFRGFEQNTPIAAGWRTFGYPLLLAMFSWIFGEFSFLVINILALYISSIILLKWCREWQLSQWVMIALISSSMGLIALSASALSEIPFILFLLLNIDLLKSKRYFWGALLLSFAVAIRPAAILLWIPEVAIIFYLYRPKWYKLIIFILIANSCVFAWSMRNYIVFGHFAYTAHSGHYLLHYKVGSAISTHNIKSFEEFRQESNSNSSNLDMFEKDRVASKIATQWILQNPYLFATAMLKDLPRFFMPDISPWLERTQLTMGNRNTLDVLRSQGVIVAFKHYCQGSSPLIIALVILYAILYCLSLVVALYGGILLWQKHKKMALIASLLMGYFWILPVGNLDWRFRTPICWLFFLLIAFAIKQKKSAPCETDLSNNS